MFNEYIPGRSIKSCEVFFITPFFSSIVTPGQFPIFFFAPQSKLNSDDLEKERDSLKFAKNYHDKVPEFLDFISNSDFSVKLDYKESWKYIKEKLHSLERHTNLGLCFEFGAQKNSKT